MSSILKALKKVENDNTLSRRGEELKIDAEILRGAAPARISATALVFISVLLFAGGSVATYFIMMRTNAPETNSKKPPTLTNQQNQAAGPTLIPFKSEDPAVPVKPQHNDNTEINSPKKSIKSVVAAPAVVPVKPAKPVEITKTIKNENGTKSSAAVIQTPLSVPDKKVPVLRVNGIAFQNSSADSMAIINGNPVANGAVVEGVTVEEIRKDRVIFKRNGEKFEIQLGQSNQ